LINQIYDLFAAVLEKEFEIDLEDENLYRLFTMIQTDIPLLQQNFAEEEENIQFLYEVVSSYIEKHYNLGC
jgi:hypothetical protein